MAEAIHTEEGEDDIEREDREGKNKVEPKDKGTNRR